jgi:hypothetical protein
MSTKTKVFRLNAAQRTVIFEPDHLLHHPRPKNSRLGVYIDSHVELVAGTSPATTPHALKIGLEELCLNFTVTAALMPPRLFSGTGTTRGLNDFGSVTKSDTMP